MTSPSAIALHAAGLDPISEYTLTEDARCVMCGLAMRMGGLAARWQPKDTFTNWTHLLAPESDHLCPHCTGADREEFKRSWATGALYNPSGVHKTNSADTLAHALLHPPQTPFVWVRGDQKQQHLVWRTPVTTDANLLRVRLGERVVTIRRLLVLDALRIVREAEETHQRLPKDRRLKKRANPGNESGFFKYLDWSIDSADHSLLSDGLLNLAAGNEADSGVFSNVKNTLQSLNFGEIWALMILLKSKNPTKPEIIAKPKNN